jgi:hypothetical protein
VSLLRSRWLLCGVLGTVLGCAPAPERYRTFSDTDDQPAEATADSTGGAAHPKGVATALSPGVPPPNAAIPPAEEPVASPPHGIPTQAPQHSPRATTADPPSFPVPPISVEGGPSPRPPRVPEPIRIALAASDGEGGNGPVAKLAARGGAPPPAVPREPQLLVPEKEFPRVAPGGALRVSYDDLDLLKVLNMEPVPVNCVDYFPDWLKSLDGARIRIRGFMIPPLRETGLPAFTLARDNQICCFGRDPKVYDVIPVQLKEGTTTDYIPNRPFDVVGRFVIRPQAFRGKLENLYEIEDAEIIAR